MIKKTVNKIGGAGKFGKRKYNRGRLVDGVWVLGGICQETKEMFDACGEEGCGNFDSNNCGQICCWNYDNDGLLEGIRFPSAAWLPAPVNYSPHFLDPVTQAHTAYYGL